MHHSNVLIWLVAREKNRTRFIKWKIWYYMDFSPRFYSLDVQNSYEGILLVRKILYAITLRWPLSKWRFFVKLKSKPWFAILAEITFYVDLTEISFYVIHTITRGSILVLPRVGVWVQKIEYEMSISRNFWNHTPTRGSIFIPWHFTNNEELEYKNSYVGPLLVNCVRM